MMKLGEALKKYREEHEITQVQMARLLSVTVTTLSRWENGHNEPLHKLIRERIREVIGRVDGTVRLTEAVGGHPDLVSVLHWTAEELADKEPDHVKIEHRKKEILIRLKVR